VPTGRRSGEKRFKTLAGLVRLANHQGARISTPVSSPKGGSGPNRAPEWSTGAEGCQRVAGGGCWGRKGRNEAERRRRVTFGAKCGRSWRAPRPADGSARAARSSHSCAPAPRLKKRETGGHRGLQGGRTWVSATLTRLEQLQKGAAIVAHRGLFGPLGAHSRP